jgi:cation diffusion facilitator family transporter
VLAPSVDLQATKEKRQAAASSVLAAVFLTGCKLVAGVLSGSLGILAEALHSAMDLMAALMTLAAVRIADNPPDDTHPYGHGKAENLSALVETLLLLITCGWVAYEAVERLYFGTVEVESSVWAFLVMAVSMVVDYSRSRVLYRTARKHNSQALEADALHFTTDILSSAVVIGGLGLVWLSERLGPQWAFLVKGDAIAALAVAVIVLVVTFRLGRRALDALMDSAPAGFGDRLQKAALSVTGVNAVTSLRSRQAGAQTFVDITVQVDRQASLEKGHEIATEVDRQVSQVVGRGDVVVHIDPICRENENLAQQIHAVAARGSLHTHEVHAYRLDDGFLVEMHVEVPANQNLREADTMVRDLREKIMAELPQIREVVCQIEPAMQRTIPSTDLSSEERQELNARISREIPKMVEGVRFYRAEWWRSPVGYDVVAYCGADGTIPVQQAHHLVYRIRQCLLSTVTGIAHAAVHLAPEERQRGGVTSDE